MHEILTPGKYNPLLRSKRFLKFCTWCKKRMPKKQIDPDVLWFILHGILHTWHCRTENERNLTQDESPWC